MKLKKSIFLFLALLSPVVVFLFLKMFGRNEFQVPVLHEDGIIDAPADCHARYATPYRLADSVMNALGTNAGDSLFVLYFDASMTEAIERVSVEFEGDPFASISAGDRADHIDTGFLRDCILLMPPQTSIALIDHKNRIRGYYDGTDRDEIDRLILEMKIILKKY